MQMLIIFKFGVTTTTVLTHYKTPQEKLMYAQKTDFSVA